ncbi:DUF4386 domain-containing protein [Bacillus sp. T33-2]|uniref:DUF4386 domain-containing protein n=1 Tax=Bacillus sp. T33-2 TaxID=2054168 RepID=UPI000C77EC8C|nr:DUF4386 domain-containing protein [Bacillus sp. T33-2]PLR89772.1 DUF4386 domain-containing protein [Bacillus sp. T33-2]
MSIFGYQVSYLRKSALIAGTALIIMTLAASFSYGIVFSILEVEGDASTTYHNIMSSNTFFGAGIMGWLIILICDIVVAWGFYIYLEPFNKHLSKLAAWFRMIYAGILGIAILNLIFILLLTKDTEYFSSFQISQLEAFVMLFLNAFDFIWSVGLIIFGGHLLIVGYLTFKSNHVPKVVSILLLIAAAGYMVIHFNFTFFPQFDGITKLLESFLTVPMILGEMGFGVWLLLK